MKAKRRKGGKPTGEADEDAPVEAAVGARAAAGKASSGAPGREAGGTPQRVDPTSVFIRGLPKGTDDNALRAWLEARVGPTVTCFAIRDDYGLAKFKHETDARRCMEGLQGQKFEGAALSFAEAKPKRHATRALPSKPSRRTPELGDAAPSTASSSKNAPRTRKPKKDAKAPAPKRFRVIVRNLSFSAAEKHIRKAFGKLGGMIDVHLPAKKSADGAGDRRGVAHRGFGFVEFSDKASAEKAIAELNGAKICGRGVAVDWAVAAEDYARLQTEEEQQKRLQRRGHAEEPRLEPDRRKRRTPQQEAEDEEEGSEEEDEEDEAQPKAARGVDSELRRMKDLMDKEVEEDEEDDEDEDDEEDEDGEGKKGKAAGKKTLAGKAKAQAPGFDADEDKTLFVRNVPFDATEEELRTLFQTFGKLRFVRFVKDPSGQHPHRGSAFVKYVEVEAAAAALAAEAEADRKLKEMSGVVKRSDQRDLPAVEGFGITLKGRRLVIKQAVAPKQVQEMVEGRQKGKKGSAQAERKQWMHLLHLGSIKEDSSAWEQLSLSERRQRQQSRKERKFRINNPNFAIDPLRLSIRNLPTFVDATRLRSEVVSFLAEHGAEGLNKKERRAAAERSIVKASLVRDSERRNANNERRSRGFGFIAFSDHGSALKILEHLNNNPRAFGGGRRPIVEFAVEDKRKLRMQQDLYKKHAHKLQKPGTPAADADKGKPEDATPSKGKKRPHDEAAQAEAPDATATPRRPDPRKKKKPGESRGRRQRERRRAEKAAAEERQAAKAAAHFVRAQARAGAQAEREAELRNRRTAKDLKRLPDAGGPASRRRKGTGGGAGPGMLSDDFELRAMERFRQAGL